MERPNFSGGVYWLLGTVRFRECNDVFLVVFHHRMLSPQKNVGGSLVRRKVRREGFKMNQDGLETYMLMYHGYGS